MGGPSAGEFSAPREAHRTGVQQEQGATPAQSPGGRVPAALLEGWAHSVGKSLVPASSSEAHSNCVRSKTGNLSNKKLSTQHCATQSSADAQRKMQCDDLTRRLLEMTAKQHHLHGREDRSATKNQPNSDSQARTATGVLVRVGRSWLTEAVPGHERLRRATSISRLCTALADESLFQSRNATS